MNLDELLLENNHLELRQEETIPNKAYAVFLGDKKLFEAETLQMSNVFYMQAYTVRRLCGLVCTTLTRIDQEVLKLDNLMYENRDKVIGKYY